ncbi:MULTISPECIES: PEP-CTERM sorting domain-containing protein [unclassified Lentimonas]|uniref:PEP-CTERM sorting domain-containing protein n=1 Tax=unclassified Lentimonas TaxID=2630993 RepID=UPI0013236E8E|nr:MULTISPECIES: PEP-CTERM sorting domain-containing protein [unclassified Lentimonas]CAA6692112.1 Unannotated [Lentimonas sp. CC19]CAA6694519.1 Unannotated [Lentimonas sp. CC10]CAA7070635.1 Unannotated [Lentimonas sp. CC11]
MKSTNYTRLATVAISLLATSAVSQAALLNDLTANSVLGDGSGITYTITGDLGVNTQNNAGTDDLRFTEVDGGSFTIAFSSAVDLSFFNTQVSQGNNFDSESPDLYSGIITANAGTWSYSAGVFNLTSGTEGANAGASALSGLGTDELTIGSTRGFFTGAGIAGSGAPNTNADWGTISISGVTSLTYVFSNTTNYDAFRIDAVAVPEPSSFALIGGLLALSAVAVRRRA